MSSALWVVNSTLLLQYFAEACNGMCYCVTYGDGRYALLRVTLGVGGYVGVGLS